MAKILITSLGVGQKREGSGYKIANYEIENKIYEKEAFIAKALATHYGIEKIFMLGTSASIWDEVYRAFGGKDEEKELALYGKKEQNAILGEELSDVNAVMDKFTGGSGSACFLVSYGLNKQELWGNFEQYLQVSEYINSGDELYLDITHSFRSLAMMSFQMIQFIQQVRQKYITIKGIFYGMFEYSEQNNNITPVIDIGILAEIQEWTKAIGYLKHSGSASMLYELVKNGSISTDKETTRVFMHLSNSISMGNINGIRGAVKIIKGRLNNLENNPIASYISSDIREFVQKLDYDCEADFCIALAKWFESCHNYGMAYLVLAEAIISKVRGVNKLPNTQDGVDKAKNIISSLKYGELSFFTQTYYDVKNIRHSIAHNTSRDYSAIISDIDMLPKYIERIEQGFKKLDYLFKD